ncbi:hypothetical protein DY000_02052742 [Brassica cretica]|uniref:Uncharacterized protein n=1 Tax=Brassica cretica TaxID=69181 RepID=A0ABQ7AA61_BRACR|nr:hypothetical protein DY000_02052742 [Brassica cretica]
MIAESEISKKGRHYLCIAVEQRTHTPIKRSGFELQRLSVYLHIVIASQNRAASTEGRGRDLALRLLDDC